jgi:hypothetical protein
MSTDAIEAYTNVEEINRVPYKDWTTFWWSWALQGPRESNPVFDPDGRNADRKQPTKYDVKFLAGTFDREKGAARKIRSNDRTSLLIPVVNSNISREEHDNVFNTTNNNATVLGAANDIISIAKGSLRIDSGSSNVEFTIGSPETNTPQRIQGAGMTILTPGQGIVQSRESGADLDFMYSALDGYWVFLKPLAADEYKFTIHGEAPWFGGAKGESNFVTDVTYMVTIDKA